VLVEKARIDNQATWGFPMGGITRHLLPGQMAPVSHYCHSVRAGDTIYVSGVVGVAADGSIPEDTVEQFRLAMAAFDAALRAAGGTPDKVVKVQVFLIDMNDRTRINPQRQAYFGEHRPASTLVQVTALVDPRMKVEIEAVAYIGP
jgi:2-iminobutanoate/2-iminopropanoate deaminase